MSEWCGGAAQSVAGKSEKGKCPLLLWCEGAGGNGNTNGNVPRKCWLEESNQNGIIVEETIPTGQFPNTGALELEKKYTREINERCNMAAVTQRRGQIAVAK